MFERHYDKRALIVKRQSSISKIESTITHQVNEQIALK